jgi:hypothetical protein
LNQPPRPWIVRWGPLLIVGLAVALAVVVRLRLATVPLERDEGEYASAGQLLLDGVPPYAQAYNMKFPGQYYAYGLVMALFGQTETAIRVGLLLVNLAATLLVYLIGRRLLGTAGAVSAAAIFAVHSLDRWVNGTFAHATHFMLVPALGGLLLVIRAAESPNRGPALWAGVCAGLAVVFKQHAVFYVPCLLGLLVSADLGRSDRKARWILSRAATFGAGVAVPLAAICLVVAAQGLFGRFWFWTVEYASAYVSQRALADLYYWLSISWYGVRNVTTEIWALGALGLVAIWLRPWPARTRLTLVAWLVTSFIAMCPGLYFRPHYFVLLLPSVALLAGAVTATIETFARSWSRPAVALVIAALPSLYVLGHYAVSERAYLFTLTPEQVSRLVYRWNPFVEAREIGWYIRAHSEPGDRVAVLGNEPEILFYARRRPATGYIYTYALVEPQPFASRMQREMIREVEAARPAFVVFTGAWVWNIDPGADRTILDWADRYLRECYDLVGVMDLHALDTPTWLWDDAARAYQPRSDRLITTHRRKPGASCGG